MLFFTSIKVSSFDLDNFVISWTVELNPPVEDITKYRFYVQRSNAPEGPFDELNTTSPLIDTYTFIDSQIDRLSKWRRYYYRVRCVNIIDTPTVEIISDPADFIVPKLSTQRLIQLEIIRTEKILLQGVGLTPNFVGVKSLAFIRRTFGQRCSDCWDFTKKKVNSSRCFTCFGVGFKGGYHTPILVYINYSPPGEQPELSALGEMQPNTIRAWMTNYPVLTEGDLIVDANNARWRVANQTRTEMLRTTTRQTLALYHLPPGDVEYYVPVNSSLLE